MTSHYVIEFIDSQMEDDAMFDQWNILQVEGKVATQVATCWDETIAQRLLAGLEVLDLMESGLMPGYPRSTLQPRKQRVRKTQNT